MSEHIRDLQRKLQKGGYPVGAIDGLVGRNTATAFQEMLGDLGFDFKVSTAPGELVLRGPVAKIKTSDHPLPWMAVAYGVIGLHEVRDNKDLQAFLRLDKSTLGDPAKLPWCGDYVHTALGLGLPGETFEGRVGLNPYLARNWLEFGIECGPAEGAVAVFWRGSRNGTSGHVAFYVGEDNQFVYVLGGNQKNTVSVTKLSKSRLLGYRWPRTSPFAPSGPRFISDPSIALSVNEA